MFRINDLVELTALHKALMQVRYTSNDVAPEVKGSPLLGPLHSRVVDAIVAHYESVGRVGEADNWKAWRRWKDESIVPELACEYLVSLWPQLSSWDEKREAVCNQMSPFTFTERDVDALMAEVEERAIATRSK